MKTTTTPSSLKTKAVKEMKRCLKDSGDDAPSLSFFNDLIKKIPHDFCQSLLVMCAHKGWPEHMESCLKQGALVDGCVEIKKILGFKPYSNASYNHDMNALAMAIFSCQFETATLLLEKGANPNFDVSSEELTTWTAGNFLSMLPAASKLPLLKLEKEIVDFTECMIDHGWNYCDLEMTENDLYLSAGWGCEPVFRVLTQHLNPDHLTEVLREEVWSQMIESFDLLCYKHPNDNRNKETAIHWNKMIILNFLVLFPEFESHLSQTNPNHKFLQSFIYNHHRAKLDKSLEPSKAPSIKPIRL